jgi:hypothetical protein
MLPISRKSQLQEQYDVEVFLSVVPKVVTAVISVFAGT